MTPDATPSCVEGAIYSYDNAEAAKRRLSFQLQPIVTGSKEAQDTVAEIQSLLTQHGMRIARKSE